MPHSHATQAEADLTRTVGDMQDRIADDAHFAGDVYRALANRRWYGPGGTEVSLSWRRAEEIVNGMRDSAGTETLELAQTGGEGTLAEDVEDELGRRGWRSEPLDTSSHDDAHATSPESPPPEGAGEREAPSEPPEAWRRAHEEADSDERLFETRPDESGATWGRDPRERK